MSSSSSSLTLTGKPIGPVGLGLIHLTWRPHRIPDPEIFAIMKAAIASGANFWNGGEFYGPHPTPTLGLELLTRYFTAHPEDADKVVLSVKGGCELESGHLKPQGDRESVRRSVDNVLRILDGKKFLDVFECARIDRNVPVEETIATLAEYVRAGKIGGIGLSEVSADTIRRAHAVHPIAAVEVEVSLWSTEIFEAGSVADTCAELGIPIVAYSPLGRGMLTGKYKSWDEIPEGDFRRWLDRFKPGNFEKNLELVDAVKKLAERQGVTPAQLCLAWVRAQGNAKGKATIIPIPGSTVKETVEENCKLVEISEADLKEVDEILAKMEVRGGRYNDMIKDLLMV